MTAHTQLAPAAESVTGASVASLDEIEEARAAGRRDAAAFAARLTAAEASHREERLAQITLNGGFDHESWSQAAGTIGPGNWQEFERLLTFHSILTRSRSWLWMQRLRRLVGREW